MGEWSRYQRSNNKDDGGRAVTTLDFVRVSLMLRVETDRQALKNNPPLPTHTHKHTTQHSPPMKTSLKNSALTVRAMTWKPHH